MRKSYSKNRTYLIIPHGRKSRVLCCAARSAHLSFRIATRLGGDYETGSNLSCAQESDCSRQAQHSGSVEIPVQELLEMLFGFTSNAAQADKVKGRVSLCHFTPNRVPCREKSREVETDIFTNHIYQRTQLNISIPFDHEVSLEPIRGSDQRTVCT